MMDKKKFLPALYPLDRDIKKTWFIKYRDATGRPRKKYGNMNNLHTRRQRLAESEKLLKQILEPGEIYREQMKGLTGKLQAVLDEKRAQLAEKSYQSYSSFLAGFAAWFHQQGRKTDPGKYINFMFEKGYHRNYILRCKITLGSWFKILVKANEYPVNPFQEIKIRKIKAKSLLPFHPDQVSELKRHITERDPQLWDACLFEYYLFMRPAEIRLLKVENILFHSMQLAVGSEITKDDDELVKVIPMPMRPVIEKFRGLPLSWYLFGKGGKPGEKMLSRDALSKRHKKFMLELNYPSRFAFYSWVHTGAKNAAMAGVPMKQLQLQKGHHDLEMFNEYLKNIGVGECEQLITRFPAI